MKTHKTIAKRIRTTAGGTLVMRRRTTQHLVARVSKRSAKQSGKMVRVSQTLETGLKRLLPYG